MKIALNAHGGTVMQTTGIKVLPEQWDRKSCKIVRHPQKQVLNALLAARLNEWQMALLKLAGTGEARTARSASELKKMIMDVVAPKGTEEARGDFLSHYEKYAASRRTPGTRDAYRQTLRRMEAFDKDIRLRTFADIDKRWLTEFEAFMSQTAHSANARAFHFRNIRAVFNYAIDEEKTTAYPFRKFTIRKEETRKRSLSVEELRTLRDYPCEEYQARYRDMFMLMFYLIGINAADLFLARPRDVVHGRLEYKRAKTGKLYSVLLQPEALEIIERYRGKDYLLNVMDEYKDYRNFLHRMGIALKEIGPVQRVGRGGLKVREPLFPDLSSYWSRHTWATIAAELDVPKETISEALGHSIGSEVTAIYIRFDQKKVDAANRLVIDHVNGGL